MVHIIIPTIEALEASKAKLLRGWILRLHGMPEILQLDRSPRFWKEMNTLTGKKGSCLVRTSLGQMGRQRGQIARWKKG
jgi:hypothetical protein